MDTELDDDRVVCSVCNSRNPSEVRDYTIFWVDCDKCGSWFHNECVLGKNSVSKSIRCENRS